MKKLILLLLVGYSICYGQMRDVLIDAESNNNTSYYFSLNGSGSTGNIVMQGTGKITIQWGDSTSTSYTLTGSDLNISHTYTYGINHNCVIDKPLLITKWSMSNNPIGIIFNTLGLSKLTTLTLNTLNTGAISITVNTANCTGLTYLQLNTLNTGTINITVNTANCTGLTYLQLNTLNTGAINITVNTANCTVLTNLTLYNLNTGTINITVNTANCTGLTYLQLNTLNTGAINITVNTANCTGLTYLYLSTLNTGTINLAYTTHTWSNSINYVRVYNTTATLSSASVDSWCNDIANATWAGSGKVLYLTGTGIGVPTSASLTARTVTLPGKGVTVTTN